MLHQRSPFPIVYIILLLPLFATSIELKTASIVTYPILGLIISRRPAAVLLLLIGTALATLVPLLVVVQAAVCSSSAYEVVTPFERCIFARSVNLLLNICLLSSISVLAAANEWRGTLPATINRMGLSRNIRIIVIVAIAMIGGFRRSFYKIHHSFTSRGEALPSLNWRNLVSLPIMLGATWATELNSAASRINGQWSAPAFWASYVPDDPSERQMAYTAGDIVVLAAASLVLVGWSLNIAGVNSFFF
jgi:hypothetical protein